MNELEFIKRKILLKRQAVEMMLTDSRELSHIPAIQSEIIELHDQAAELLLQDAVCHESEAKRLREEAAPLEVPEL